MIFILSLYKLHPMGLLLGLAVFALKGRDRKIFSVNILLLIISFATFFIDKIVNNYETAGAVYRIQTYGILNSANVFSFYTSGSQSMFYIIFLIFFALLVFSKLLDKTYSEIKYENFINNYLIYSLIFWFVPTIFYTNHVYRLPLFFILFFFAILLNLNAPNIFPKSVTATAFIPDSIVFSIIFSMLDVACSTEY